MLYSSSVASVSSVLLGLYYVAHRTQQWSVCMLYFQRLLSNEEEKNKEIIQEVCFMVSFNYL